MLALNNLCYHVLTSATVLKIAITDFLNLTSSLFVLMAKVSQLFSLLLEY